MSNKSRVILAITLIYLSNVIASEGIKSSADQSSQDLESSQQSRHVIEAGVSYLDSPLSKVRIATHMLRT